MKKRILVSVDHMYAMGVTAVDLINNLTARLKSKRYLVFAHTCPDVPRAILQSPEFFGQNPQVGNSFWFDFGTELLTKAKVCEEIMSQWKISLDANEGMVIFCKNMNGTIVHGLLRNPNWHEDGMDGIEDRMRCGISAEIGEQVFPDLNILLDATSESVLPVYSKSIGECLDKIDDPIAKENMRIFFDKIDFLSQRQLYLDEFALMGNKALTLNTEIGMDEMVEQAAKRIEELLS